LVIANLSFVIGNFRDGQFQITDSQAGISKTVDVGFSVAPLRLSCLTLFLPAAYAAGYILPPLRG
jgi:hypothetical protein